MTSTNSPASPTWAKDIRVARLLDELKALRSPAVGDRLSVFIVALCFLGVGWLQGGPSVAGVCAMGLTLVFMVQGGMEARNKRQIELVVKLMGESQKQDETGGAVEAGMGYELKKSK